MPSIVTLPTDTRPRPSPYRSIEGFYPTAPPKPAPVGSLSAAHRHARALGVVVFPSRVVAFLLVRYKGGCRAAARQSGR